MHVSLQPAKIVYYAEDQLENDQRLFICQASVDTSASSGVPSRL